MPWLQQALAIASHREAIEEVTLWLIKDLALTRSLEREARPTGFPLLKPTMNVN